MTTNATIGLISAICLGLVILWDYFRRKKERVIWLKTYNKTPDYGVEEGKIHHVFQKPFTYIWHNGNAPEGEHLKYPDENVNYNSGMDPITHEKVLEDIKKVEANYDSEYVNQIARTRTL